MAASPSESPSPPPPPPPPPPINNNNSSAVSVSNGPTVNQTQDAADGAATTSTAGGTKPWQRAWSVDEMRKGATTWSLASDAGMLHYLQEFSQKMISQTHKMEQKVDGLVHETKGISAKVHNTFNDFLMLSNTQFIENRVYDEEERKDEEVTNDEANSEEKEKTREELESEVIPKINDAITSGLSVVASAFETVEVTPEQTSDGEDDGNLPENLRPEPILELTDIYAHRKLPYFIGSREFLEDDLVGLAESDDDMASEPSVGSQEQSELTSESGSETVSGSSSASEESSTATESEESGEDDEEGEEEEKVAVPKKKQKKETVQDESVSEDELFAAGGVEKSSQPKQDEDSDDESDDEQPKKSGAPLDFAAELAAKIGVKPPTREDSDQDNDGDNEQDWEESGRHSEQAKDDLFSASVDTTSTVASKGSRKKKEKSKHKKSRSGSQASRDSAAVVAAVPPGDNEQSTIHDVDDQDDLFTSSIDTTSTHVSKASRSSRHKHKTKKKDGRSDSQLSTASSKSGKSQPDAKKTSDKSDSNLFGASPEGDLFDDDMSSPFGKKGGMFSSSGGGLFDEVNEDNDNQESKSDIVPRKASRSSQDQDESDGDEVPIKPKPRTSSSGKKLPAGAVAIFGDHGPFGHMPVHSSEHHVEKNAPPAKKSEKEKNKGGGLFSDERDDLFTSSQSSVASSIKPPVATKKAKSVDLFGDDDDADDDDDSLFGAKPAKKREPKPQPSKKKLPAGAVSMFGSSPPPLFSTSPTDNEPVKSVVASISNTTSVKAPKEKEAGGLFDEDDMTDSFSSEKTAPSAVPAAVVPVAVKPKRKTNQISLFDDHEDEDEGDGDDLFASISPSKSVSPIKNDKTSKPNLPNEETKPVASKPTPKRSTISLFDDDDDDDEGKGEEDGSDIFNTKPLTSVPKSKEKSIEGKPSSKPVISSGGLFGSEEDPLFSEGKTKALPDPLLKSNEEPAVSKPVVKPTKPIKSKMVIEPDDEADLFAEQEHETPSSDPLLVSTQPVKSTKLESAATDSDGKEDLFSEAKQKAPSTDPFLVGSTTPVPKTSKQETIEPSQDLFDEDNKEKDEEDGAKIQDKKNTIPAKTSKTLAGAVPMFGGVDIFAGQKLGKAKRQQQVGGLFGEDEDDLFAAVSPPKFVPSVAPRTKPPKKPAVEVPQVTKSSPVVPPKIPVQPAVPVPAVSSADKDSNVGKLQKTLAFNPAAMLPGAVRPPKKEEIVTESSFDQPASVKTLESSGRDRARIRGKRRPPTRQARRTAAKESMDDTSLFGSDISTTVPSAVSEERLAGRGGKSSTLFSDNDDLFTSNSYKAPEKSDQSVATQGKTSKSDPLFNTTKTMTPSAVSLFEDSIDGLSEDKLKPVVDVKDDVSKTEQETPASKTVTDSLFDDNTKDDPFSLSTEENLRTSQKVKVVDDDEDEDDLFKSGSRHSPPPLDFDSEATTSGDFMIDRKPKPPDDDLFSGDSKFNQDIFATLPTMDEEKTQKEKKKEDQKDDHNKDDKKHLEDKPKESDSKKTSMVDDLFGDSGSIFDDIPKKPKEKKKKKATTSKEDNIFDETKDTTGDDDTSKVKTTKKTKGKKKVEKKGKSKISIFDDDSPNIFDDPLNATSK